MKTDTRLGVLVRGLGVLLAVAPTFAQVSYPAETYTGALDNTQVTVTTTWLPNNNPGSTVQVKVSYNFSTILVPLSAAGVLTVQTTASSIITQ